MTSIRIGHEMRRSPARVRAASIARGALLACGVLSTALYAATDLLGGLRYPGYRFSSRVISELAAIGAPTKAFVDPLLAMYDLFAFPFAVGVLWEARKRGRALRVAGLLLLIYLIIGAVGFGSSPMPQRGAGPLAAGIAHVITGALVVLLMLLMLGAGAFALGRRFRVYSFATLAATLVCGAATFAYASRIAADLPTPGVGILERVAVYGPMVWLSVLAVALMRRPEEGARSG